LWLSSLGLYTS